ncbi:UDP-galactose transporter [Sparassis crispa]|uniref:UDP-galactose transporter n=1 Tax=Sparassis crispa TaxID=139825 RepID=A0A401GJ29_9APHY|nr:UDP-galactose transporter [Sparassis crispa]GBE82187.1 UDP-galactose transporter [Sparassis crispa]
MAQHQPFDGAQHALHLNLNLKEADAYDTEELGLAQDAQNIVPSICGMPLKYVSLVTLAVQNASLTLIMHYSRVSAAPSHTYSAGAAVLVTELLKGFISLAIAFSRIESCSSNVPGTSSWNPRVFLYRFRRLGKEVFRSDCWKLSVPAILYVIQNNLQFVAVSNLEAATFQVSYQMKILTTAAFSVLLLRKKLNPTKWLALFFLAIGVGIVQIQSGTSSSSVVAAHDMNQFKGFMAVVAACFTSGLAGVYFEMVLKNSQADLWVRNVQLSLFSLLPALLPIVFSQTASATPGSGVFSMRLFENFGVWAWATVLVQVLGGLLTALVIKYADNILKGFATSLSIVISFLASVALFNFQMTITFILGSTVVLVATWMYNQPENVTDCSPFKECKAWWWKAMPSFRASSAVELSGGALSRRASMSSLSSLTSYSSGTMSFPGSPVERDEPILSQEKKRPEHAGRVQPLRAIRVAASQLAQFVAPHPNAIPALSSSTSLVFTAQENVGAAYVYPTSGHTFVQHAQGSLSTSASYPTSLSRPSSALSTYPTSRPASAMGGSVSSSTLVESAQAP